MINNFKQIRELLTFEKQNDYYFIEILKRRKDNPRMTVDSKFINDYYVYSLDDYDQMTDEILCYSEILHARAYIRLNVRNAEKTSLIALKRLSDFIYAKDFKSVSHLFRKVSREVNSEPNHKFLVDIDNENDKIFAKSVLKNIWETSKEPAGKILAEIPTPNGCHLITTVFDSEKFVASCPNIHMHKDCNTVLYSPGFDDIPQVCSNH